MDEWITTKEAGRRLDPPRSSRWIATLCAQDRLTPKAKKMGRDWFVKEGAKIEPTGLGRPLRTLEIPREAKKGGKR